MKHKTLKEAVAAIKTRLLRRNVVCNGCDISTGRCRNLALGLKVHQTQVPAQKSCEEME